MALEQTVKTGLFEVQLPAGNKLCYKVVDARTIEIYTNANVTEEKDKDKITKLTIGNLTITIGGSFKQDLSTIPSSYTVNSISQIKNCKGFKYGYFLDSFLLNMTTEYIVPCLGMSKVDLGYDVYLCNAYLTDKSDQIGLLYRFSTHERYGTLEMKLIESKNFIELNNSIPDFDLIYMKISKEFLKDIELFKKGSYSKLSPLLKEKMVSFHGLKEKDYLWQVIYKGSTLMKKIQKEFGLTTEIGELEKLPKMSEELLSEQKFMINGKRN